MAALANGGVSCRVLRLVRAGLLARMLGAAAVVSAEDVIDTAQAVFPEATVKSRRGPLPVIIVDQQEKAPLTRGFDPKLVQVETAHLETGDYSLKGATHLLAIERKSLGDLLTCCTSDRERFMDQLRRLKNYPTRFLVVEATREEIEAEVYSRNVRAKSVINTLLGAAVRWNVCVQYCDGPSEAARMVQWICLKTAQLQKAGFYEHAEPTIL